MVAQVQTLWSLPAAPLIQGDLVGAIFVMIWLVLTLLFAYALHTLLRRSQPTWPEFKDTLYSVLMLAFWYFTVVLDRWLRKDSRAVVYGYIVWLALCEFVRVVAGIYLQWGLYKVVWRELVARGRVERANLWRWWLAAKLAIVLVFLAAAHYLVLQLTTAAVWVRFDSLNTIQDIATKRNAFAVTTAVFSMVFAALTVFAATNAMRKSRLNDGGVTKTRMALWVATIILLARALSEIGTTAIAVSPGASLQHVMRARDISYGLLTCLYFVLICIHASGVSRPSDRGNEDTSAINSNMRKHILDVLRDCTEDTKIRSPDFDGVLRDLESRLDALLAPGNPSSLAQGSTMSEADNKKAAVAFIQSLRERVLPGLNPREGRSWQDEERARHETVFDRITRSAGSALSRGTRKVSDGSLGTRRSSRGLSPAQSETGLLAAAAAGATSTSSRTSLNPGRAQQMRQTSNQSMRSNGSVRNLSPTAGPTTMQQFGMDPIPERPRGGGDAASMAPSMRTAPSIFPPGSLQQQPQTSSFQARQQPQPHGVGNAFPFAAPRQQQQPQPPPPPPASTRSSLQFPPTPPPASIITPSPPHQVTYEYPPVGMQPPPQPQSMYGAYYNRASPQQQQQEGRRPAAPVFTVPPDPVPAAPVVEAAAGSSSLHGPPVTGSPVTRGERHLGRLRAERAAESRYARPPPSQTQSSLGQEVEMMDVREPGR